MKHLNFLILLTISLTFSKILLVPEEFLNIQQAVVVAQNGDTVSVNFSRPNGQHATVVSQQIMGKEITFEVRGGEKEKLLDMIKDANNPLTTVSDTGWTEQTMVNRPDSLYDDQPHIAIDNLNCPWVVWRADGVVTGFDLSYARWNGSSWDENGVIPYTQEATCFRPRITFDDENRAWVVYDRAFLPSNDTNITYFTRWNGTEWEPEAPVHQIDSIKQNFAPRITAGGDEIWCTWYGDISATRHNYDIYVSRWNGDSWEPKMKISPPVGSNEYLHWFCDIAVDRFGHPHVVWGETWFTGRIYYRTHNGQEWQPPVIINNPDSVRCAGWPAPSIAIDNEDNIHVVWIGFRSDSTPRREEVYYSKFERGANIWLSPVQINRPDRNNDCYPDIVITENPCDIWVGWHKGITSLHAYIYVSHFDGNTWLDEERLDNENISYSNVCPELAWNSADVWAVWNAFTVGIDHLDIYYSRYLSSSLTEESPKRIPIPYFTVFPNPFVSNVSFFYKKDAPGITSLAIYSLNGNLIRSLTNRYPEAGYYKITWDGKDDQGVDVIAGVYFYTIKTEEYKGTKKLVLMR